MSGVDIEGREGKGSVVTTMGVDNTVEVASGFVTDGSTNARVGCVVTIPGGCVRVGIGSWYSVGTF